MMPPELTARVRRQLGPDKLLLVGLSVAPGDADQAKITAREVVSGWLGRRAYAATIAEVGYSAEEIAGVSDRLVDAVVAHGHSTAIAGKVSEHLAAGADHITLLPAIGDEFAADVDQLERLAPALAEGAVA